MIIRTTSQAQAFFDILNQRILRNVVEGRQAGRGLNLDKPELDKRLQVLVKEGFLLDDPNEYRIADSAGFGFDETADPGVHEVFAAFKFEETEAIVEEAKSILAEDKERFHSNIDVELYLSSKKLTELKFKIVELVQSYAKQNDREKHQLCRFLVRMYPGGAL